MNVKLDVPFSEKDEAKKLGAKWLADQKTWVIPDTIQNINPFGKWLPTKEGVIVRQNLLIAKSEKSCWKCAKITPQIALGAKKYYEAQYVDEHGLAWDQNLGPVLFSSVVDMPIEIANQLNGKFPFFKYVYSKTINGKYWGNVCGHCGVLQGDFFNFNEPGGAFFPTTQEEASQINVGHFPLDFACYLRASPVICTTYSWFIK